MYCAQSRAPRGPFGAAQAAPRLGRSQGIAQHVGPSAPERLSANLILRRSTSANSACHLCPTAVVSNLLVTDAGSRCNRPNQQIGRGRHLKNLLSVIRGRAPQLEAAASGPASWRATPIRNSNCPPRWRSHRSRDGALPGTTGAAILSISVAPMTDQAEADRRPHLYYCVHIVAFSGMCQHLLLP